MYDKYTTSRSRAFTLVELLVVIAIISVLSSIVISSVHIARVKGRDAARIQNIHALSFALESYYIENGEYPKTFESGYALVKKAECVVGVENYIPGLAPTYISKLPSDPALNCDGATHSWVYASNGMDYKLITHHEIFDGVGPAFLDPAQDRGPDLCVLDDSLSYHMGVWTEGAACWTL